MGQLHSHVALYCESGFTLCTCTVDGSPLPSSLLVSVLTRIDRNICISCSFSADELTGCVGVIHSAQLDNLTLTIVSVERSGGVNCTVDELMEGNYSVAVFGQLPENVLKQEPAYVSRVSVNLKSGRLCVVQ